MIPRVSVDLLEKRQIFYPWRKSNRDTTDIQNYVILALLTADVTYI
jgi:hypothetical protein